MPKTQTNGSTQPLFDWTKIVTESVDAWPEPKNLPPGHYQFTIKGGKLDKGKGVINLALQPVQAAPDVDETALAGVELESTPAFVRFDLSRHQDVARYKQFARAIGVGEYSIDDGLKAMRGSPVMAEVTHTPKDDGTDGVYVNVRRLGPVTA